MKIQGATALVTGANRGLGRHLAQQLRDRARTSTPEHAILAPST
jgi:NAD(P)-dependent dehydrogenase (short-subunit alcohol dehydrogenase family)